MVLKLSIYQEERIWRGVKLHGFQTHATLSSRNTLEAEEIAGHSNQRCRRFCFVIIIPYPDRKANICSIYRWKKNADHFSVLVECGAQAVIP